MGGGIDIDFTSVEQVEKGLYELTLDALKIEKNERLWFKANVHLAKWYFRHGQFRNFSQVLKKLYDSCDRKDGTTDSKKTVQLLLLYSMEIQMHSRTKNYKKLKELHTKALAIKGGVQDPRVIGIIRESGGKMYMLDKDYDNAHANFLQAFLCYDDSGSPRKIRCLKYLLLVGLFAPNLDPFSSSEAQQYKEDPEIIPLSKLLDIYRSRTEEQWKSTELVEIRDIEGILKNSSSTILNDEFLSFHIYKLINAIRIRIIMKILKPHSRMCLSNLSQELNMLEEEVEHLLLELILDKKLDAKIDQVNNIILIKSSESEMSEEEKDKETLARWKEDLGGRIAALEEKMK